MIRPPPPQPHFTASQKLALANEQAWLIMGNIAELATNYNKALTCYESAVRHNQFSVRALTRIAWIRKDRGHFPQAADYFKRVIASGEENGEITAALGHCHLMMGNFQQALNAYQRALSLNHKDQQLWYGIGVIYDQLGSLEHAEKAFLTVIQMDPKFEKVSEVCFRLGIIYKQQQKYDLSLHYFHFIVNHPPKPLSKSDVLFQKGLVHEQKEEYESAKEAYEQALLEKPGHAKLLQRLGRVYHQRNTSFCDQERAIQFLKCSIEIDEKDAESWYILGLCYMIEKQFDKAYDAYQSALRNNEKDPRFWYSMGVYYYFMQKYKDSIEAYIKTIRLNPNSSDVWYALGLLYEACDNHIQDALDSYNKALELDPANPHCRQRIEQLRNSQNNSQHPLSVPRNVTTAITRNGQTTPSEPHMGFAPLLPISQLSSPGVHPLDTERAGSLSPMIFTLQEDESIADDLLNIRQSCESVKDKQEDDLNEPRITTITSEE